MLHQIVSIWSPNRKQSPAFLRYLHRKCKFCSLRLSKTRCSRTFPRERLSLPLHLRKQDPFPKLGLFQQPLPVPAAQPGKLQPQPDFGSGPRAGCAPSSQRAAGSMRAAMLVGRARVEGWHCPLRGWEWEVAVYKYTILNTASSLCKETD